MKILVTSGATREPIDSVRFITNMSTGYTGASLAEVFHQKGHDVLLLRGLGSTLCREPVRMATFVDFSELNQILQHTLREEKIDAVIHLAAVSDFSVDWIKVGDETHFGPILGKLDSSDGIEIMLKKNIKILECLKSYGQSYAPFVVGFKLTSDATRSEWMAAVAKLYKSNQVDLVVHNDTSEISADRHPFRIVDGKGLITECVDHHELGDTLNELLRDAAQRNSMVRGSE